MKRFISSLVAIMASVSIGMAQNPIIQTNYIKVKGVDFG